MASKRAQYQAIAHFDLSQVPAPIRLYSTPSADLSAFKIKVELMVDEKKKKNKKKKNKLDKSTIANTNSAPENSQVENEVPKINEDFDNQSSTRGVGDSADVDQNHASVQGNLNHVSNSTQFENDMAKTDVEMDLGNQLSNGGEGMILEETVDTSPRGNDPPTEQQTSFESKLLQLEKEKDSCFLNRMAWMEKSKNCKKIMRYTCIKRQHWSGNCCI